MPTPLNPWACSGTLGLRGRGHRKTTCPFSFSEDAGTSPVGLGQSQLTAEGQARGAACPRVRNKTQLLPPSCDRPCDREKQRAGLSLLGVCPSLRPLPCTWCNAPLQGFYLPCALVHGTCVSPPHLLPSQLSAAGLHPRGSAGKLRPWCAELPASGGHTPLPVQAACWTQAPLASLMEGLTLTPRPVKQMLAELRATG